MTATPVLDRSTVLAVARLELLVAAPDVPADAPADAHLVRDLGVDSLGLLEFVARLEYRYGLSRPRRRLATARHPRRGRGVRRRTDRPGQGRRVNQPALVTGLGAITPAGPDVASTWQSLLRGETAIRPWEDLAAEGFPGTMSARVVDDRLDDPLTRGRGPGGHRGSARRSPTPGWRPGTSTRSGSACSSAPRWGSPRCSRPRPTAATSTWPPGAARRSPPRSVTRPARPGRGVRSAPPARPATTRSAPPPGPWPRAAWTWRWPVAPSRSPGSRWSASPGCARWRRRGVRRSRPAGGG